MRVVAIDQGTTSTRALVLDEGGKPEIVLARVHAQFRPQPEWVEQDPSELVGNISACLDAAGEAVAIGIGNQGESCLAWDRVNGEPLSPVIVWQDNRTFAAVEALRATGAEAETIARAGLPLDSYFAASKLAWIVGKLPEARAALRAGRLRLGTTDAFFLDRLAGTFMTDVTTASRTSLMNLETGDWDSELCRLFGVPQEALPEICPTAGSFGEIGGRPVTASVVDQHAALYGHLCRAPGDAKITFGTRATALAVTGDQIVRAPERGLLSTVAWRIDGATTFAIDGSVYDAGAAVDWARRLGLFENLTEISSFDAPPAISRGLAFVPALSGLACPHWDRTAAALWIGMSTGTTRKDLCQALLEGIAMRTAEVIEAMDSHAPIGTSISIDGGLARNDYFAQFLADVLQRRIVRPEFNELTALGCAQLAARGAGLSVNAAPNERAWFEPRFSGHPWRRAFSDAVSRSGAWR